MKVLVTGASSGIGRSAALHFARLGAELFLSARREKQLAEAAEECRKAGSPRTRTGTVDLSIPGNGAALAKQAMEELAGLDTLVLNAGYGYFGPVTDVDAEAMARMWQVNFHSAYESIQEVLPSMMERKSGNIVLVSSIIGKKGMPFSASYCATKFAQAGLGEALWGELRRHNIHVAVVCPGFTDTEFHEVAGSGTGSRPFSGQSSDAVGKAIVKAVRKRRREVHLTLPGKLLLFIDRISRSLASRILLAAARYDSARRPKD